MADIRYGIIGTGMMGLEHIRNIELIEGARVVAVADPTPSSLDWARETLSHHWAARPEIEVGYYEEYRAMLAAGGLDAVVIATPNYTHRSILEDVLAHDVAVMVEKPLCTTWDDCLAVRDLARRRSALTWVGLEYRYMPPMTHFIHQVHEGAAGAPQMISIREHRFPFLEKVGAWNRFNRNTGGTFVEKCCHFFDLMILILRQQPVRVFASGAQNTNHRDERVDGFQPDIFDNGFVIVDFDGGARGLLDLCMFAEGAAFRNAVSVVGDLAKIDVALPQGRVRIGRRDGHVEEHVVAIDPHILDAGSHYGATYYQHAAFLSALRGGTAPEVDIEDGCLSVAMGLAAHRSIEENRPVMMREFADYPLVR